MIIGDVIKKIGKVVKGMFSKKVTVEKAFDTSIAVSGEMENSIQLWAEMYKNKPPWKKEMLGLLNLAATVSAEMARLVTTEMQVKVSGSPMADYINTELQKCIANARQYTEFACAKGGVALKPYVMPNTNRIGVSIVHAGEFYPTKFDSN